MARPLKSLAIHIPFCKPEKISSCFPTPCTVQAFCFSNFVSKQTPYEQPLVNELLLQERKITSTFNSKNNRFWPQLYLWEQWIHMQDFMLYLGTAPCVSHSGAGDGKRENYEFAPEVYSPEHTLPRTVLILEGEEYIHPKNPQYNARLHLPCSLWTHLPFCKQFSAELWLAFRKEQRSGAPGAFCTSQWAHC